MPHCPSSLGGNIPLPGPPPPASACPCPLPSAHHPRLFSSPPQLPRPLSVLLPCLLDQLGLISYLGLAVRSPSTEASAAEGSVLAWAPAGRRERFCLIFIN